MFSNTRTLRHSDNRSDQKPDRAAIVLKLQTERANGRSCTFNLTFLDLLERYPDLSLADAWQTVENHFAGLGGVRPDPNPYL